MAVAEESMRSAIDVVFIHTLNMILFIRERIGTVLNTIQAFVGVARRFQYSSFRVQCRERFCESKTNLILIFDSNVNLRILHQSCDGKYVIAENGLH